MSSSTESTSAPDYASLVGSRVRVVYVPPVTEETPEPGAVEIIASVDVYNEQLSVLMVREKGKTIGFLIELADLIEIELSIEPSKIIKTKRLKEVDAFNVRQHLADRHGLEIEKVNLMTDEQAEDLHNDIDHSVLGHYHQDQDQVTQESDENESQVTAETGE